MNLLTGWVPAFFMPTIATRATHYTSWILLLSPTLAQRILDHLYTSVDTIKTKQIPLCKTIVIMWHKIMANHIIGLMSSLDDHCPALGKSQYREKPHRQPLEIICDLTHWGLDKMAADILTTFSNAFSWMKIYVFRLTLHWSLFLRVKLTIFHHWFR